MTASETPTNYSSLPALDNLHNAYQAVCTAVSQLEQVSGIGKELRSDLAAMREARNMILWEWVDQFQKLPPQTRDRMPKTGELVEAVETVLAAHGEDPVTPAMGIVPLAIENYHLERDNKIALFHTWDGTVIRDGKVVEE